jgi:hypothetical protein
MGSMDYNAVPIKFNDLWDFKIAFVITYSWLF